MPGIIFFKRRWSVGSDDMILPSFVFLIIHSSWLVILTFLFVSVDTRDWRYPCMTELYEHSLGYLIILIGCVITELCICICSSQGTIMNPGPRSSMAKLLYLRLGILVLEIFWLIIGLGWLYKNYDTCDHGPAKDVIFSITICNSVLILIVILIGWCSFDRAGRSWVKMKRYQNSLKENQCKYKYKRSGNSLRNWRHRKAVQKYQDSWNRRCRLLFCCLGRSDRHQSSFSDIAKILSEFFRDLDVVPTDVIAGLIIIRKHQKLQREIMINSYNNEVYQYLSGVPITSDSNFLNVNNPDVADELNTLIYYLDYAMAVYGWPIFLMYNKTTACCKLCPYFKCTNCIYQKFHSINCFKKNSETNFFDKKDSQKIFLNQDEESINDGDNCCACNNAALNRLLKTKNYDLVYTSYHVEIGEPPFIVVLDHDKKSLVVSVRGTLSLQDILTDLNAEGDLLPTNPQKENWLAHKGMIEAAVYIQKKLTKNKIIEKALNFNIEKNTQSYTIVLVGHSLGAGTVSILAILLKELYPDLLCYAFSPPGGLLSLDLVNYSKNFITSVVLGKDIVPRLGLRQMESLRYDLIHAIKESQDPKWKIIGKIFCCCSKSKLESSNSDLVINTDSTSIGEISNNFNSMTSNSVDDTLLLATSCSTSYTRSEKEISAHPHDSSIALTVHQPLYPPGKIIHIVRYHPENNDGKIIKKKDVVYRALYVDNCDFNEILISPVMLQDHLPNKMMEGLQKLFVHKNFSAKIQCKTVSNNYFDENVYKFKDHFKKDNLIKPLLSYQYNSNWSNDTLDNKKTILNQPKHKDQLDYPSINLRDKNEISKNQVNLIDIDSLKKKQIHKGSIFELLRKIKKIDFSSDDWLGLAPLASPEILSETSSICSKNYNDFIVNSKRNSLKTVSENVTELNPTTHNNDSVSIQIENEQDNLKKVDVTLNIDVNALFDQMEKNILKFKTPADCNKFQKNIDQLNEFKQINNARNQDTNDDNLVKNIIRTSSLKRNSFASSSYSKHVTFNSTAVMDTGETSIIDSKKFCRRSNSEKINRHKLFSYKRSQKLKRQENQIINKQFKNKSNDEVDNEKNEKLEKQLKGLLGHSFSYSDTDLNKVEKNLSIFNELNNETIDNNIKIIFKDKSTNSDKKTKFFCSPVKKLNQAKNNIKANCLKNNKIKNETKTEFSDDLAANKNNLNNCNLNEELVIFNKKKFEKLFQKLSTIEPIEETEANKKNFDLQKAH